MRKKVYFGKGILPYGWHEIGDDPKIKVR